MQLFWNPFCTSFLLQQDFWGYLLNCYGKVMFSITSVCPQRVGAAPASLCTGSQPTPKLVTSGGQDWSHVQTCWWLIRVALVGWFWLFGPKFWKVAGTCKLYFGSKINGALSLSLSLALVTHLVKLPLSNISLKDSTVQTLVPHRCSYFLAGYWSMYGGRAGGTHPSGTVSYVHWSSSPQGILVLGKVSW